MPASKARRSVDTVAALERSELFRKIPRSVLKRAAAVVRELHPNQILFAQGEYATAVYVVFEGELRCVRQDAKGREQVLAISRAGALLAAVPALDSGKFYSTAIANTVSLVLCIERKTMQKLCMEEPQLLWNLVRLLGNTVRRYAEIIETLALRNVDQRVAQFLLSLCEQAPRDEGYCRNLELRLTQPEMAARVGSTREVVCRALAHLEKYGLLEMHGPHRVRIPDTRMLRRFAGIERALTDLEPPV
ncbi:MAG TPA: Crp/Fnr family transcriptional regulator [Bryobacteraceae bacterium]|jgi:CRP-like cAMP-binding protein